MKIPTDVKISGSFIAVFLLGLIPVFAFWLPDVLIAIAAKTTQDEKQRTDAERL
jgi:hypothetical protein